MSNYVDTAYHPETGELEEVMMLDDQYGRHHYGVRFPCGKIYEEHNVTFEWQVKNGYKQKPVK